MTDDETEEKPAPPASTVPAQAKPESARPAQVKPEPARPAQAKPEPASELPVADPWATEGSESGA